MSANVSRDAAQIRQAMANVENDRATVRQVQANLQRDMSQLRYLRTEEERYRRLLVQGMVTREQYEQQRANAQSYEATLNADRAAVSGAQATLDADQATIHSLQASQRADEAGLRNAHVQLSYTSINSPLDGRTGSLNLYEGALVRANDTTPLITIDQIMPIYVSFAIPEKHLSEVRRFQTMGPLRVSVDLSAEGRPAEVGRVSFIDSRVDVATGTITLRATFPNRTRHLWPGRFVNVVLGLTRERDALLVPSQAVQPGQTGSYVFVVKPDQTVEVRDVTVGSTFGDRSVIRSGVRAGDMVVTDGQLQLRPGASVTLRGAAAAARAGGRGEKGADPAGRPHRKRP